MQCSARARGSRGVMAVDVDADWRRVFGNKEKPANAKSGSGKTKGDVPSRTEKQRSKKDARAAESRSPDPKSSQKTTRGGGKPPRPLKEVKGAAQKTSHQNAQKHLGVSPSELVAGLAGSLAMCVVGGVSRLVRAKFGGRAEKARKEKKALSAPELEKLESIKAELRDAVTQLREQRRTMDHLAAQNREMARENHLLKRAAANAAAAAAAAAAAGFGRNGGSPSGPLSNRPSPMSSAPASPSADGEDVESGKEEEASRVVNADREKRLTNLLEPLPPGAGVAALETRRLVVNVLASVLGSRRDGAPGIAEGEVPVSDSETREDSRDLSIVHERVHALGDIEEEDAWAGVPRGSPGMGSADLDDAGSVRSAKSFASGLSAISDLSTVSAAEAALSKLHAKHVLMARIKRHR